MGGQSPGLVCPGTTASKSLHLPQNALEQKLQFDIQTHSLTLRVPEAVATVVAAVADEGGEPERERRAARRALGLRVGGGGLRKETTGGAGGPGSPQASTPQLLYQYNGGKVETSSCAQSICATRHWHL